MDKGNYITVENINYSFSSRKATAIPEALKQNKIIILDKEEEYKPICDTLEVNAEFIKEVNNCN